MAEQQQQEQERPGVRRRSSLGRAMERVRDALKKRRSSAQGTPTLQSTREEGTAARPAEQQQQQAQPPAPTTTTRAPKAAEPRESIADSQLEADDQVEDESNVHEEPLTTAFSSRTGISEDKARALFGRYGIKYQPRTTAADGDAGQTNKVRRVERQVRIRIHWTCHQCQRQFGPASACVSCGHRRCGDCARSPPKRVKAIVDEAEEGQLAQANKSQILAAVAPRTAAASDPQPSTTADKLDVDDADDDGNPVDISQLSMQTRPNSGIKLVMRSKPPTMRRICHECQTPFKSRSATQCEKCSHQRCDACPVRAAKMAGVAEEQPVFEPKMVASVQRVYRKPRQRVRWQCDKCQTTMVDGHRCAECNHERCGECVRSPVKRAPYEPDPAVLQSLNDKIEAWQRQRDTAATTSTPPAPIAS